MYIKCERERRQAFVVCGRMEAILNLLGNIEDLK